MLSVDYARKLAQYNEWMNRRLFEACLTLPAEELYRDRGAFFGSIFKTLHHIYSRDLSYLSRFTGEPKTVPALDQMLCEDFSELYSLRQSLDQRLQEWVGTLEASWLSEPMVFTSVVDGKARQLPRWLMLVHMFNHQTHHRGQVTTLLSQRGVDMGSTDIPFMPDASHIL